jgi:hypothetical protein
MCSYFKENNRASLFVSETEFGALCKFDTDSPANSWCGGRLLLNLLKPSGNFTYDQV